MEDIKVTIKIIEERLDRFLNENYLMTSDFLTLEEQSHLNNFLNQNRKNGVYLYGGYQDSERKMVVFIPDYLIDPKDVHSEEDISRVIKSDSPIKILECTVPKTDNTKLSHRDYLGALMGEGIKREKIGDILVHDKGCQIIVMNEMADYLKENYSQVSHATITTEVKPIEDLKLPEIHTVDEKLNVASPRLDNVVSEVFHMSRTLAKEAISKGLVFVNGIQMSKNDYTLKDESKLVLRGKGKVIYHSVVGQSKKGNSYIAITRYL